MSRSKGKEIKRYPFVYIHNRNELDTIHTSFASPLQPQKGKKVTTTTAAAKSRDTAKQLVRSTLDYSCSPCRSTLLRDTTRALGEPNSLINQPTHSLCSLPCRKYDRLAATTSFWHRRRSWRCRFTLHPISIHYYTKQLGEKHRETSCHIRSAD